MPVVALAGTAARAFSDGRAVAIGALGDALPHNTMALVNVAYNISYGWTKPLKVEESGPVVGRLLSEIASESTPTGW